MHRPGVAGDGDAVTVPPVLTDGVVTLRGHLVADAPGMLEVHRDPVAHRWTTLSPLFGSGRPASGWTSPSSAGPRAASSPGRWRPSTTAARYAGSIDLRRDPVPSVGYLLAPWARGRGFASRALRLAADWGFDVAGFAALHWDCRAGHVASWRVAHACGFRFEGVRPGPARRGRPGRRLDRRPAARHTRCRPSPATTWWPHPVLDGDGVRLRPPTEADLARHVEACNDPVARWWSATLPVPYTDDDARRWLRDHPLERSQGAGVGWVIADPDDDRYLGTLSVFGTDRPYSPTGGEVGYRAHPDARGRGAVSAAVRRVVRHAFTPVADGGWAGTGCSSARRRTTPPAAASPSAPGSGCGAARGPTACTARRTRSSTTGSGTTCSPPTRSRRPPELSGGARSLPAVRIMRMSCCGTEWVGPDRAHCCRRFGGCGAVFDDAALWDTHRPAACA